MRSPRGPAAALPDGRSVFEIGPGTGLVTRELLARGVERLVAVESDPELARLLSALAGGDRLHVVNAPFEDADLGVDRFDVACAAASFHWLDTAPSLAKVHAALVPDGTLALWWNSYRNPHHGDLFAAAVLPLMAGLSFPPFQSAESHDSHDERFWQGELIRAGFGSIAAEVRALFGSYSFIRRLDREARERLLDAIAVLAEREFGGVVPNVALTA
jgi:SAM-dependent methyltransferase